MSFKDTIFLPRTPFSMKAGLKQKEPKLIKKWEEMKLYQKMLEKNRGREVFILHDGPPYSNGHIHVGHVLNKILKDIVVKYKNMKGYFTPFVPGWDNHGMPIENEVIKEMREKNEEITRAEVRKKCRIFAQKWVEIQKEEFKRLGVIGDWNNPYLTMDHEYEAEIINIFGKLAEKGYIYRDYKPLHYCIHCETVLANAEIEYEDKVSYSIWVAFPLKEDKNSIFSDIDDLHVIVWTTTPWTLPGNVAVAFNPDFKYLVVKADGKNYLLAEVLYEKNKELLGWNQVEILKELKGKEIEGTVFINPVMDRESVAILADFVTSEQGTGCVHIAPGHGEEDFVVGKKYGLPVLSPVDEHGRFTEEAGRFAGLHIEKGNREIIEYLKKLNKLLKEDKLTHSYPHCWRCHKPLIFRTTPQWFLNVDHNGHRIKSLKEIDKTRWFPGSAYERIKSAIETRPDWCLSRQRFWGVGIPAFHCKDCNHSFIDTEYIKTLVEKIKEKGSDIWFEEDYTPPCPKCGSKNIKKEEDILDVWFDSGCSSHIVMKRKDHRWPPDLYLEGSDQHRGWFNLSLMVSVGLEGRAPYREVVTHGFVVDQEGRAMHKSLGNVIKATEAMKNWGSELLRLWVGSTEYFYDVRIGEEIIERLIDAYRKIRNTVRFMLGSLADFQPEKDSVPYEDLHIVDKYMLSKFEELKERVYHFYDNYEFHRIFHKIYNFCVVDLSSFYLDISKDRLYTYKRDSKFRRGFQTVIYKIVKEMILLFAPILSFTMEEAYENLPGEKKESVFLDYMPEPNKEYRNIEIENKFKTLTLIREVVQKRIEIEREKGIGSSLEVKLLLKPEKDYIMETLKFFEEDLPFYFITSQVEIVDEVNEDTALKDDKIGIVVDVKKADGKKCERCWIFSPSVGEDKNYPTLCKKCVEAVKDYQKKT